MTRPVVLLAAVFLCAVASAQQTASPQTTFKSGVDLILIEATVLDKDGRPIADLQAKDFSIKLGGKVRTVAAAEYIPAGRAAVAQKTSAPGAPVAVSTSSADAARAELGNADRTIMIAVDVDNIRSGAGRNGLVDVAEYVATLPPTDRVGMVTLPGGGQNLEPTTDRSSLRAALSRTAGGDHRVDSCEATIGEAAAEAVNDSRGQAAYGGRVFPPRCAVIPLKTFVPRYRAQTLDILRALTSLAANMAALPGRRAIVLVSEGLYSDPDMFQDLRAFGGALERSRVVLYAIHLDFPFMEASSRFSVTATRRLDDRYGFDAMADAAFAGGGTAIRAISRATPAIRQIDTELSGTYLLGIERLPSDVAGKALEVKIDVGRKGTDVRARQNVTITK